MRRGSVSRLVRAGLTLGLLVCCLAPAQERPRLRVQIKKLEFNKVRTPAYRGNTTYPGARPEQDWLQVFLEFEVDGGRGGWTDQLTVDWTVLVRPPNVNRPLLLQESTTFVDLEDGKQHAAVYIRPAFIRRHCDVKSPNESHFAAYVEISADGRRLDSREYSRGDPPKNWWRAREPDVRLVPDELLPPWETPFAPLDYDFYAQPKRKRP